MIIDWFWMALIVFVVSCSVSGMYRARQSRLKAVAQAQRPPDPRMCSCGHGAGQHSAKRGCAVEVKRSTFSSAFYDPDFEWVRCECMRFDGTDPEAIVRNWSPPEIRP